jgi:hypothetical protein
MEDAAVLRASVYWLTSIANSLQGSAPTPHRDAQRTHSGNSNARALNHLAAILSRGKNADSAWEATRTVAVTSGPFTLSSLSVSVFARPDS